MTDVTDIIAARRQATRGLSRAVTWSVAVHVAAVALAVVVPRDWPSRQSRP
jgi:hypothetical protein